MKIMIDAMKVGTPIQAVIMQVRELDGLIQDEPKKGFECYRLNKHIKFQFRPAFENSEFVGYSYLNIILFPHYLHNGKHNGNDFNISDSMEVLTNVFKILKIDKKYFSELDVINLEVGVNVIPETPIKEIIPAVSYYKSKPFRRNKAKYSLISETSKTKQLKIYAKGLHALEALKTNEVHPNTMRFEIKTREKKFLNLTVADLFKEEVYNDFQNRILNELEYTLILEPNPKKANLTAKERNVINEHLKPESWKRYLADKNRNKFNNERKKYEKICAKMPTIKAEIKDLIQAKFNDWKNRAKSTEKKMHKEIEYQQVN